MPHPGSCLDRHEDTAEPHAGPAAAPTRRRQAKSGGRPWVWGVTDPGSSERGDADGLALRASLAGKAPAPRNLRPRPMCGAGGHNPTSHYCPPLPAGIVTPSSDLFAAGDKGRGKDWGSEDGTNSTERGPHGGACRGPWLSSHSPLTRVMSREAAAALMCRLGCRTELLQSRARAKVPTELERSTDTDHRGRPSRRGGPDQTWTHESTQRHSRPEHRWCSPPLGWPQEHCEQTQGLPVPNAPSRGEGSEHCRVTPVRPRVWCPELTGPPPETGRSACL